MLMLNTKSIVKHVYFICKKEYGYLELHILKRYITSDTRELACCNTHIHCIR